VADVGKLLLLGRLLLRGLLLGGLLPSLLLSWHSLCSPFVYRPKWRPASEAPSAHARSTRPPGWWLGDERASRPPGLPEASTSSWLPSSSWSSSWLSSSGPSSWLASRKSPLSVHRLDSKVLLQHVGSQEALHTSGRVGRPLTPVKRFSFEPLPPCSTSGGGYAVESGSGVAQIRSWSLF
jgi:hypothetical protein